MEHGPTKRDDLPIENPALFQFAKGQFTKGYEAIMTFW